LPAQQSQSAKSNLYVGIKSILEWLWNYKIIISVVVVWSVIVTMFAAVFSPLFWRKNRHMKPSAKSTTRTDNTNPTSSSSVDTGKLTTFIFLAAGILSSASVAHAADLAALPALEGAGWMGLVGPLALAGLGLGVLGMAVSGHSSSSTEHRVPFRGKPPVVLAEPRRLTVKEAKKEIVQILQEMIDLHAELMSIFQDAPRSEDIDALRHRIAESNIALLGPLFAASCEGLKDADITIRPNINVAYKGRSHREAVNEILAVLTSCATIILKHLGKMTCFAVSSRMVTGGRREYILGDQFFDGSVWHNCLAVGTLGRLKGLRTGWQIQIRVSENLPDNILRLIRQIIKNILEDKNYPLSKKLVKLEELARRHKIGKPNNATALSEGP
jgi:hypothetical protein